MFETGDNEEGDLSSLLKGIRNKMTRGVEEATGFRRVDNVNRWWGSLTITETTHDSSIAEPFCLMLEHIEYPAPVETCSMIDGTLFLKTYATEGEAVAGMEAWLARMEEGPLPNVIVQEALPPLAKGENPNKLRHLDLKHPGWRNRKRTPANRAEWGTVPDLSLAKETKALFDNAFANIEKAIGSDGEPDEDTTVPATVVSLSPAFIKMVLEDNDDDIDPDSEEFQKIIGRGLRDAMNKMADQVIATLHFHAYPEGYNAKE